MVKKRTSSRRRVTNIDLQQIVADNHTETVERLTRIETSLASFSVIPEKVERLEGHNNRLKGAIAIISLLFTTAIGFLFKHH